MYYRFWGVIDDSLKNFSGDMLLGMGLLCSLCMTLLMQMAKCVGHTMEGNVLAGGSAVFAILSGTVLVYRNIREQESIAYSMGIALGLLLACAYIESSTMVIRFASYATFWETVILMAVGTISGCMGWLVWFGIRRQIDGMRRKNPSAVRKEWDEIWWGVYWGYKVYKWICRIICRLIRLSVK